MQDVIDDPITLLQAVIQNQVAQGHTFEGTVLNIATQQQINFLTQPNQPKGLFITKTVPNESGGIENILFLEGTAQYHLDTNKGKNEKKGGFM